MTRVQAWFDEDDVGPELQQKIFESTGVICHFCGAPGRSVCDECAKKQMIEQGITERLITEERKYPLDHPDTTQHRLFDEETP